MKKLLCVFFAAALFLGLAGCASSPEAASNNEPESSAWRVPLTNWIGTWNSFSSYFGNPGLNEAYSTLAQREGKTPAEIKQRYLEGLTYQCDIAALGIDNATVTFYTVPQTSQGSSSNVAYKAAFHYAGPVDIGGRIWEHFETDANIPYKHLLLLPAEADVPGKTMIHYHFRYGDNLNTLIASDGWFPTMVSYDSTIPLLVGHMTNED